MFTLRSQDRDYIEIYKHVMLLCGIWCVCVHVNPVGYFEAGSAPSSAPILRPGKTRFFDEVGKETALFDLLLLKQNQDA